MLSWFFHILLIHFVLFGEPRHLFLLCIEIKTLKKKKPCRLIKCSFVNELVFIPGLPSTAKGEALHVQCARSKCYCLIDWPLLSLSLGLSCTRNTLNQVTQVPLYVSCDVLLPTELSSAFL